jgi:hypothetical protein
MQRSFSNSLYQYQIEWMDQQISLIFESIDRKEFDLALKQADDAEKIIDEIDELKDYELKYTFINLLRGMARV